MLKSQLALGLAGAILFAAPVFAQSSTTAPSAAPAAGVAAGSASSTNYITDERAGEWRASKLKGLNVYNNGNEKIGEISELLLNSDGTVDAAVLSVGGFLGIGEHYVAVPFKALQFTHDTTRAASTANTNVNTKTDTTASTNRPATSSGSVVGSNADVPDRAVFNATKDQLKAAPQFKWNRS